MTGRREARVQAERLALLEARRTDLQDSLRGLSFGTAERARVVARLATLGQHITVITQTHVRSTR